jgi:3-deoxy-7-phosphoheptulonate synthase
MIDCSHGNSGKDFTRQPTVAREVARQMAAGSHDVCGVMIESHLVEGRQDMVDRNQLTYGQSITDACLSWEHTEPLLEELASAVRHRRG